MSRPSKPINMILLEGRKNHITKKEVALRKQGETATLSGKKLRESAEVKSNPVAHAEFIRIKKLLAAIDKADDLYGSTINRYCLMVSECNEYIQKREQLGHDLEDLRENRKLFSDKEEYYKLLDSLTKKYLEIDKVVDSKRRLMMAIEKENIMTIASALRSVPKRPDKKQNALREALSGS